MFVQVSKNVRREDNSGSFLLLTRASWWLILNTSFSLLIVLGR